MKRLFAGMACTALVVSLSPLVAPSSIAASGTMDCSDSSGSADFTIDPGETLSLTLSNCYGGKASPTTTPTMVSISYTTNSGSGAFCVPGGTNCDNDFNEATAVTSLQVVAPSTVEELTTQVLFAGSMFGTENFEFRVRVGATPDPGGDSGSSGTSFAAAPTLELNLDPVEADASCSVAGVSGTRGSWVPLEAAADCTAPPSNPGATLLGWATTPDFPVDIAQRQVDNGWGAYEIFNDDGQLTSVFIPAGGMTQLTASNSLYAIWGS